MIVGAGLLEGTEQMGRLALTGLQPSWGTGMLRAVWQLAAPCTGDTEGSGNRTGPGGAGGASWWLPVEGA